MLEDYRRKRDFTKSPEPSGDSKPRKVRERFFCVQKHLASHLHYDFRLEHNGVLLSWAVPKGPSLDPKTKRLAMHVEDHPIEYGDFEGVIPEGYGAGIVMLWDRGTWTPEVEDVDAALKKGDLKFSLNGYKLKGSWVLVRTRGWGSSTRDDGRSWLLIKHKDEWSGDLDIAEFAPRSVKSDGDFSDIVGEDAPAIWQSNRPAKSGDAGAMFARILGRAEALKKPQADRPATTAPAPKARVSKASAPNAPAAKRRHSTAKAPREKSKAAARSQSKRKRAR
jgi:DNA ligase D-like protein (predicted 3'-phosphoesterase)